MLSCYGRSILKNLYRLQKFITIFVILGGTSLVMPRPNYEDALDAVNYLKKFITATPEIAIVTGSGLGRIIDMVDDKITIDVHDIPHWPGSTAPGHEGKIIIGKISGRPVVLMQGRVHYYEGYSMREVTFPVRVLGMLGVKTYIATNAAGAINTSYSSGDIVAVKDHINLMGTNPLIGLNDDRWNTRFPDMSSAYDKDILAILDSFGLKQGVYVAMTGPSFETPAEIRMAGIMGADLVGMSTVPEVIVANAMGMRVAVLSCVSNLAAGLEPDKPLSSQEVLDIMADTSKKLEDLLLRLIDKL